VNKRKVYILISVVFVLGIISGIGIWNFAYGSSDPEYAIRIVSGNLLLESGNLLMNNNNITGADSLKVSGDSIYLGTAKLTDIQGAIQFSIPPFAPSHSEGLIYYDSEDRTFTIYVDEPDVALQIGQEQWIRVINDEEHTIFDGQAVYISGALEVTVPKVKLACSDNISTSRVIGLATHDIESGTFGYVTTFGIVRGINTLSFQEGERLFVSALEAGDLTNILPIAPDIPIPVGWVIVSHETEGRIFVSVESPEVISELQQQIDTLEMEINILRERIEELEDEDNGED